MANPANPNFCSLCRQPSAFCLGRTKRDAGKVEMMIVPRFQNVMAVPCYFRERIDSFLSAKKWLIVKCPRGYKYDLYVEKFDAQTFLCGPYWRQLVACYNPNLGEKLTLTFDPEELEVEGEYEADFYDSVGNPKEYAIPGQGFLCNHMLSMSRQTLQKTIFSNLSEITNSEMCEINWVIFKEIRFYYLLNKDQDFYDVDQFFVHRIRNQDFNILTIPGEIVQDFIIPCSGNVQFANKNLEAPMHGTYEYHKGQDIKVIHGWNEFRQEAEIENLTLIMVLVKIKEFCIRLEVSVFN